MDARSTGSHCSGQATGCWLTSASLLATMGFVMCGMEAAQKAAATLTRTSARELEASFFTYPVKANMGEGRRLVTSLLRGGV